MSDTVVVSNVDVSDFGPDAYSNARLSDRSALYSRWWSYYTGQVLDNTYADKAGDDGKKPLRWPARINLVRTACIAHAAATLGEFPDEQIIDFHVRHEEGYADKKTAAKTASAIRRIWRESHADGLLLENALFNQVYGGQVWAARYDPHKSMQCRVEIIDPVAFTPTWSPTDYHRLIEVQVYYQMDSVAAQKHFNLQIKLPDREDIGVREHWTEDRYEVYVGPGVEKGNKQVTNGDGQVARYADGTPMAGKNPFVNPATQQGVVPFEYIPRLRAGSFYGESLVAALMAAQDEVNERVADLGDGVAEAIHQVPYVRNRPEGVKGLTLSRRKFNNLGMAAPNQPPPEVGVLPPPQVQAVFLTFLEALRGFARLQTNTPAVAEGVDEGSQRSALTLAFRMWPLTSIVRFYRAFMGIGLCSFAEKCLLVAHVKAPTLVTAAMLNNPNKFVNWAPMIPRDREQLVNEMVLRKQARLASRRHAVTSFGDVLDVDEELAEIDKDVEAETASQGPQQEAPTDVGEPVAEGTVE
jgi:hypothetical protein